MKICFLLGGIQTNGGIGRVTSILANRMCALPDPEVTVLAYVHKNEPPLYKLDDRIGFFHLYDKRVPMVKALLVGGAVKKVRQIIRENHIDLLIACGALFYPLGIKACKKTNARCLCWEHTDPASVSDHKFQGWCRKYAVKHCEKMIVLTKSAEKFYLEKLKIDRERLTQIYNPVDEKAERSPAYDASSKKILSVGRLAYQKNFERLIKIAAKILPAHPDWSWDIYGEGPQRQELEAQIKEAGLEGRVNLMGQVNDLYDRYKNYAFMVMTSRYEGFPMSLIEGLVNRLPLISFDIPTGPDEIIKDGENGYLLNKEDDDGMTSAIETLINDKEKRAAMSARAYEDAKRFRMEDIIELWIKVFQKTGGVN